jgi:Serine/threonine protein phosphatase
MFVVFWTLSNSQTWLSVLVLAGLVCLILLLVWLCYRYWLYRRGSLVALLSLPLQKQPEEDSWMSTQQLSFAAATPTYGSREQSTWSGAAIPRLRLPQRALAASSSGVTALLRRTAPQRRALWDVPTRPAYSPSSSGSAGYPRITTQLSSSHGVDDSPSVLPLQASVVWHPGLVRSAQPNEDSLGIFQGTCIYREQLLPFSLFVVADGMGGHACGLEASRLAVQCLSQAVLQSIVVGTDKRNASFLEILISGVERANLAIFQKAQAGGIEMGTTLTAALVIQKKAYIVNVGDSRTYLFRDSAGLIQITRDHSLVASLVAYGDITPDEAYSHPDRNKVYRCLGSEEQVMVDAFCIDTLAHDSLLLCSDGLWEMVRDSAMERVLRSSHNPTLLCDRLLQAALQGGGEDNIGAILVQIL